MERVQAPWIAPLGPPSPKEALLRGRLRGPIGQKLSGSIWVWGAAGILLGVWGGDPMQRATIPECLLFLLELSLLKEQGSNMAPNAAALRTGSESLL